MCCRYLLTGFKVFIWILSEVLELNQSSAICFRLALISSYQADGSELKEIPICVHEKYSLTQNPQWYIPFQTIFELMLSGPTVQTPLCTEVQRTALCVEKLFKLFFFFFRFYYLMSLYEMCQQFTLLNSSTSVCRSSRVICTHTGWHMGREPLGTGLLCFPRILSIITTC